MQKNSMRLSIFPDLIFTPVKGVDTPEEISRTGLTGVSALGIGKEINP